MATAYCLFSEPDSLAQTLPVSYVEEGESCTVEVDAGIASGLQQLADAGYRTIFSCSGLQRDHQADLPAERPEIGYVTFLVSAHTAEQLRAIEGAAQQARFETQHRSTAFHELRFSVYSSQLRYGEEQCPARPGRLLYDTDQALDAAWQTFFCALVGPER
jgi:hypothetical protein